MSLMKFLVVQWNWEWYFPNETIVLGTSALNVYSNKSEMMEQLT